MEKVHSQEIRLFSSRPPITNKNPPLSASKRGVIGSDVNAAALNAKTVVLFRLDAAALLPTNKKPPSFRLKKSAHVANDGRKRALQVNQ
jgi:hypothetical protein